MTLDDLKIKLREAAPDESQEESLLALAKVDAASIATAIHLWETHAPKNIRGLLTGTQGWHWSDSKQTYIAPSGQIITGAQLKKIALQMAEAIREEMRRRANAMMLGLIPLPLWLDLQGRLTAGVFTLMGALAIGGMSKYTPGISRQVVKSPEEPGGMAFALQRLAGMGEEVEAAHDANEPMPGMSAGDRAGAAAESSNTAFEDARRQSHQDATDHDGVPMFTMERSILGHNEHHCHDSKGKPGCIEVASQGWQPIGTMPIPGTRTCKTACRCRLIFR
jgi:hypothetical protein